MAAVNLSPNSLRSIGLSVVVKTLEVVWFSFNFSINFKTTGD